MKKIDVAAIRHPMENTKSIVPNDNSDVCVVAYWSAEQCAENVRVAHERYLQQLFESMRSGLIYS